MRLGEGGSSIEGVLSRALDPPAVQNVQRAMASLVEVHALTPSGDITPLGRILARLPVDVHLGILLLLGCHFGCADAALTIAALLSSKAIFVAPMGREQQSDAAKRVFATDRSDPLTLYRAYCAWREACFAGDHFAFCRRNYLSHVVLSQCEDMKHQVR